MTSKRMIEVPKGFFRDHYERDLPTPEILHETAGHFAISADDTNLPELLNDAEHYASGGTDADFGLIRQAMALVNSIKRQTS